MAGKRGTRAEVAARWRERLRRWQRLQCSIREFCRRERVSEPSFFQWRKRLAAERPDGQATGAPRGAAFIPIQLVSPSGPRPTCDAADPPGPTRAAWLEITVGDFHCRVPRDVDESTLRQLVRVLSEEAARC